MPWKFFSSEGAELVTLKKPEMRTTLPATANDGDEIILTDSVSAGTYHWHLRYVAARSSNKWVYVGGSPMTNEVATAESITSSTYGNLATTGPSIAIPVAGDYLVTIEAEVYGAVNSAYLTGMSYAIGGTAAATADEASFFTEGGTNRIKFMARTKQKSGLTAVTLTAKYKSDNTNGVVFQKRRMSVVPIAVGG